MALTDALVSIGVVLGVFVFLFARLKTKYPRLRPWFDQWFPGTIYQKPDKIVPIKEGSQQTWTEHRQVI